MKRIKGKGTNVEDATAQGVDVATGSIEVSESEKADDAKSADEKADEKTGDDLFTQAEVDRRITASVENALKRQEGRIEDRVRVEVEKARIEALEEAKMSEEELVSKRLKERESDLERREREQEQRELLVDLQTKMVELDMPVSFAEFVMSDDRDSSIKAVDNLKAEWDRAISEQIKSRARQSEPQAQAVGTQGKRTSIAELAKKNRKV